METTFKEARQRVGFKTQRHWSEKKAISGELPRRGWGFSHYWSPSSRQPTHMAKGVCTHAVRPTAWYYDKRHPSWFFSDALALVRREFCGHKKRRLFAGGRRKATR